MTDGIVIRRKETLIRKLSFFGRDENTEILEKNPPSTGESQKQTTLLTYNMARKESDHTTTPPMLTENCSDLRFYLYLGICPKAGVTQ